MVTINITFNEKTRTFKLDAKDTSYMLMVADGEYLAHVYFGKKLPDESLVSIMRFDESPFTPATNNRDRASYLDTLPMEYPCFGIGDYREPVLRVTAPDGTSTCDLRYKGYKITQGKPALEGMPATFATEQSPCNTLEIILEDKPIGLEVSLFYTAFENLDVITRSAVITNKGDKAVYLTRALSACVEFDTHEFDMITLNGSWARERAIERCRLHHAKQLVDSCKGESSHQNNPFVALCEHKADEDTGEAFGFNFVYSGNFMAQAEVTQHKKTRFVMGINSVDFSWKLEEGEYFTAPEVVMVHSDEGLGKMSRTFHDLYRNNLIRGEYKDKRRPILINNWEATYFDLNEEKIVALAQKAADIGVSGWDTANYLAVSDPIGLRKMVQDRGMGFICAVFSNMLDIDSPEDRETIRNIVKASSGELFVVPAVPGTSDGLKGKYVRPYVEFIREVQEEAGRTLVERCEIISIVFEEGRVPIGAADGVPVVMPPVPVVADAKVADFSMAGSLLQRNAQVNGAVRTCYDTAVPIGLLQIVFVLLYEHMGGRCEVGEPLHRREVGGG